MTAKPKIYRNYIQKLMDIMKGWMKSDRIKGKHMAKFETWL